MEKKYGIVKEVYIPVIKKEDVMISNKIVFIIEIDSKSYKYETEQNEEIANIMKNDKVEIIMQLIDNHKFVDIRKLVVNNSEQLQ
jgi:hypothetical protein